jgi:5-methylcytosine-specific restriction endonuclease McrA
LICKVCEQFKERPAEMRAGRRVCKSCEAEKRSPEGSRKGALKAWHKKYDGNKEAWNKRVREYRAKRKADGKPIVRNCKSDRFRANSRIKIFLRAEVRATYGDLCMYCLKPAATVDHVVPLNHGGENHISNLVPACWSCNSSKQDKGLLQWLIFKRKQGVNASGHKIC